MPGLHYVYRCEITLCPDCSSAAGVRKASHQPPPRIRRLHIWPPSQFHESVSVDYPSHLIERSIARQMSVLIVNRLQFVQFQKQQANDCLLRSARRTSRSSVIDEFPVVSSLTGHASWVGLVANLVLAPLAVRDVDACANANL